MRLAFIPLPPCPFFAAAAALNALRCPAWRWRRWGEMTGRARRGEEGKAPLFGGASVSGAPPKGAHGPQEGREVLGGGDGGGGRNGSGSRCRLTGSCWVAGGWKGSPPQVQPGGVRSCAGEGALLGKFWEFSFC